jgi:hypothetical protein
MRYRRDSAVEGERLRATLPIGSVLSALLLGSVLLSATVAGASGVQSGSYVGEVGPGYKVTFEINASATAIDALVVSFDETCNGAPADVPPQFHFNTLAITDGRFSGASTDHFGKKVSDALRIKGTVQGSTVKGTVMSKSFIKSLGTCDETEPFSAQLKK